jgi:hypothetical protein
MRFQPTPRTTHYWAHAAQIGDDRAISERPKKKSGAHVMKSTMASVHHATCLIVLADGRAMASGAGFMRALALAPSPG